MLKQLETVLLKAGELALSQTLAGNIHVKGRGDFVTDADLAVSDYLKEALPQLVPGSRVLSEEGAAETGLQGKLFIIDPIDGTTNLMYHMNLSAVSIGYGEDGDVCLGGVYNPFTQEMFLAQRGKGAFFNGQPIRVSPDETLADALIGVEAGPATLADQSDFFQRLFALHTQGRGLRLTGSAALDLCYVACGRFTAAVFHYLYPWDYAAGWLILTEAGGRLTPMDGTAPTLMGRSAPLAASNSLVHEALLEAMRGI